MIDRSGYQLRPTGFRLHELVNMRSHKLKGLSLAEQTGGITSSNPQSGVEAALKYRLGRPIVVDLTDSSGTEEVFKYAFACDADVVTANKVPLASAFEGYTDLINTQQQRGRLLKAEATVGAGLPVVETIEMLMATGD